MLPRPALTRALWDTELPLAYGDPRVEYMRLVSGVGLIDFSFCEAIRCRGRDAVSFLQGMVSQDVARLAINGGAPAWILDINGKIRFPLHIYRLAADELVLLVLPGRADAVREHLDRYLIMEEAALEPAPELTCLSLQGPDAASLELPGIVAIDHDRSGFGGIDLIGTRQDLEAAIGVSGEQAAPVGFAALDRARIEAFMPWYTCEIKPGTNPLIYGSTGISHTKGCFIGQETVAKTRDRGRPPQLLVQLRTEGASETSARELRTADGKPVGEITSMTEAAEAPTTALAVVRFAAAEADTLEDSAGRAWHIIRRATYKAS